MKDKCNAGLDTDQARYKIYIKSTQYRSDLKCFLTEKQKLKIQPNGVFKRDSMRFSSPETPVNCHSHENCAKRTVHDLNSTVCVSGEQ